MVQIEMRMMLAYRLILQNLNKNSTKMDFNKKNTFLLKMTNSVIYLIFFIQFLSLSYSYFRIYRLVQREWISFSLENLWPAACFLVFLLCFLYVKKHNKYYGFFVPAFLMYTLVILYYETRLSELLTNLGG